MYSDALEEKERSMNDTRPDRMLRILAICGIIGPITYAIVLTVLGVLWPGYNPVRQYMSELGAVDAPHAFLMNVLGFHVLGVSMVALGLGLVINSFLRLSLIAAPSRRMSSFSRSSELA